MTTATKFNMNYELRPSDYGGDGPYSTYHKLWISEMTNRNPNATHTKARGGPSKKVNKARGFEVDPYTHVVKDISGTRTTQRAQTTGPLKYQTQTQEPGSAYRTPEKAVVTPTPSFDKALLTCSSP